MRTKLGFNEGFWLGVMIVVVQAVMNIVCSELFLPRIFDAAMHQVQKVIQSRR
jgi:hypothetical protein